MRHTLLLLTIVLASSILVACDSLNSNEDEIPPIPPATIDIIISKSLAGTQWLLIAYPNPDDLMSFIYTDSNSDNPVTIEFTSDNAVKGNAGCNSYFGSYETDYGQLTITDLANTEMECMEEGAMNLEKHYLAALGGYTVYEVFDDSLRMYCNEIGVFVFQSIHAVNI